MQGGSGGESGGRVFCGYTLIVLDFLGRLSAY